MPLMTPTRFDGALPVDGYGPGFFRVGGQVHRGSVIVAPAGVRPWGGPGDEGGLLALAGQADLLFMGLGRVPQPIPAPLAGALARAGILAEAMSTPSAARSYNVTLAEGRRVACALVAL